MKVAITCTGNNLESKLDLRFGRCGFFVIYDTETRGMEFIPNPDKDATEGAGPDGKGPKTGRRLGKCKINTTGELISKLGTGQGKKRNAGGGTGKGKRLKSSGV